MSLSFCVLASGSSGNCTLVRCAPVDGSPAWHFLIDAGLSPKATALRLKSLGIHVSDIRAIVLTHLDADHFQFGWFRAIEKHRLNLRVYVHHRHRNAAARAGMSMRFAELFRERIDFNACISIKTVLLAHDDLGSVGFVIEHDGRRLGYATDLGRVPECLFEQFTDLHALAIESNYDRQLQVSSLRPWFLKRRIMGGAGHLSNEQALEAIQRIESSSNLSRIALLHLSRECNDANLVRRLYGCRVPHLLERLTITDQFEPSPILTVEINPSLHKPSRAISQLSLFDMSQSANAVAAS
jgi:phosphoribosyl 1,2-cyclic phosphodiesterase